MPTQPPIPIAVVGAGWVATHRHLPALLADRQFKVVGVVDRHEGRAAATAQGFALPRSACAKTLAEVSWLDEVRAVTIAAPPDSHASLMDEARRAGINVMTEKPFTLTMRDAVRAAAPDATVVGVMHNFQFARSAQRLWADLASGSLGEIHGAEAFQWSSRARRLPEWYEQLPLGLFFDESPHLLYLLRRLAPALRMEAAHVVRSQEVDRATPSSVWALYTSGESKPFPITLSMNFDASVSEWHLAVHGSKGVGVVDLFRDVYVRLPGDRAHETRDVLRTSVTATVRHWQGFASSGYLHMRNRLRYGVDEVLHRFAEGIHRSVDPPGCGRTDGLAVRTLQEQILGLDAAPISGKGRSSG